MDPILETLSAQERRHLLSVIILGAFLVWRVLHRAHRFKALDRRYRLSFALIDVAFFLLGAFAVAQILRLAATSFGEVETLQAARLTTQLLYWLAAATGVGRLLEVWILSKDSMGRTRHVSQLARLLLYGSLCLLALVGFLNFNGIFTQELWLSTGAAAALIAFAMQRTLGDLFSGIALSIERPFRIGDWLRFSDGTEGEVTDINWRATRLRGWDNTTHVVPNGQLSGEKFINLHGPAHRFSPWYLVRVSGDADPAQIKALLETAAKRCDSILNEPAPIARLMNAETVPFTYMIWVSFPNYPTMFVGREELYREIATGLRAAGLKVAADVQEIHHRPVETSGAGKL